MTLAIFVYGLMVCAIVGGALFFVIKLDAPG